MPTAAATFATAHKLISGDRRTSYGNLDGHFGLANLAKVMSGVLNVTVTPRQAALIMIGLKLVRESNAHSDDNLADICGYTGLLAEIEAAAGKES